MTPFLNNLELISYSTSKRLFYVPTGKFITVNNDLIVTRSAETQVKPITLRNTGREGRSSDVSSDSIFLLNLYSRILKQGEGKLAGI